MRFRQFNEVVSTACNAALWRKSLARSELAIIEGLRSSVRTLARELNQDLTELLLRQVLPDRLCAGKGFGLGGAVTFAPTSIDPPSSTGEFQWGGSASTYWWICPSADIAGVLMAQRDRSFWHPFFFEFKRLAYEAAGAG